MCICSPQNHIYWGKQISVTRRTRISISPIHEAHRSLRSLKTTYYVLKLNHTPKRPCEFKSKFTVGKGFGTGGHMPKHNAKLLTELCISTTLSSYNFRKNQELSMNSNRTTAATSASSGCSPQREHEDLHKQITQSRHRSVVKHCGKHFPKHSLST